MRQPEYLWELRAKVGVWACRVAEEGLGEVARRFWVEELRVRVERRVAFSFHEYCLTGLRFV